METPLKFYHPFLPYTITQYFGENPDDYAQFGYPGHNGLDLCTGNMPPYVYPICESVVYSAGWDPYGYGKLVICKVLDMQIYYAHLDSVLCKPGDLVTTANPLGVMGSTGNSTGPHLHLGIRLNDHSGPYKGFVDPLPFIQGDVPVNYNKTHLENMVLPPPPPKNQAGTPIKTTRNKTMYRKIKWF